MNLYAVNFLSGRLFVGSVSGARTRANIINERIEARFAVYEVKRNISIYTLFSRILLETRLAAINATQRYWRLESTGCAMRLHTGRVFLLPNGMVEFIGDSSTDQIEP